MEADILKMKGENHLTTKHNQHRTLSAYTFSCKI